jgi:O-antigen ligase
MFLNKNGLQPLSIFAFLIGLPLIALRISQDRRLITPVIALTAFFLSVMITEITHGGSGFNLTVLDAPSRHLVAAGLFVVVASSSLSSKYLWYACWIASLTSFVMASFHTRFIDPAWLGSFRYMILGSQSWTSGVQAFATIAFLVSGLTLLTPNSLLDTLPKRILWGLAFAAGIAAAALSGTRAPFIAAPLLLALYVWINRKSARRCLVVSALLIMAIVTGSMIDPSSRLESKFNIIQSEIECYFTTNQACGSVGIRLHLYHGGFLAFFDKPLLGHGMDSSMVVGGLIDTQRIGPIPHFENFHNDFIQIAVTQGLLGLAPFLFMLYFFAKFSVTARQHRHSEEHTATLWIVGLIAITSMTQMNFDRSSTTSAFIVLLALFHASSLGWTKIQRPRSK